MQCVSCGGTIGRDCFNPQECAHITRQMESDSESRNQQCNTLRDRIAVAVAPVILKRFLDDPDKIGTDERWREGVAWEVWRFADAMVAIKDAQAVDSGDDDIPFK